MADKAENISENVQLEQTESLVVKQPEVVLPLNLSLLPKDFKLPFESSNFNKNITKHLSFPKSGFSFSATKPIYTPDWNISGEYNNHENLLKVDLSSGVQQNQESVLYNQQAHVEFDNETGTNLSADIANNNGTVNGGASISIESGNFSIGGNINIDDAGKPTHNIDVQTTAEIAKTEISTAIHNDRKDTSLTINNGKIPLLRRDNNPNNDQAMYKEQKETLQQTGQLLSVAVKGGYSNECASFYTSNSIVANLGKDNFLNFKIDMSRNEKTTEFKADLRKVALQYNNSTSESKDGIKTDVQGIDFSLKGKKNIYTANWSVEKVYEEQEPVRNVSFGAKASLNRTEYGEFNAGFNGEIDANVTQQGYKFGLDGAYNYYGSDHEKTTDYMISSKTTLAHDADGTNFETGLFGALRFNNCRTIIEPHSIFELKKDTNGNIVRTYSNGVGFYQQLGKNFEDLTAYVKGGRTIYDGGNEKSYTQILAGLKKKATKQITLNAETVWNSNEKLSGNVGIIYNF